MRHAAPARAGPSATLESMVAGSLIREDAARGALPLSRMGDGCWRASIRLQRSGLLAEGRFHDGPLARGMCRPRCSARTLRICVAAHVCGKRVPTTSENAALAVLTVVSEGRRRARRPAAGPTPYAIDAMSKCFDRATLGGLVPHPPQPAGPVPHVPRAHLVAPVDRVGARPLEG